MRVPRAALRVAVASVLLAATAGVVLAVAAAGPAQRERAATAVARGTVTGYVLDVEAEAAVTWTDAGGGRHRTVAPLGGRPDGYPLGTAVVLRYDPCRPDAPAYVVSPSGLATSPVATPLFSLAALCTVAAAAAWGLRWARWSAGRRRDPVRLVGQVVVARRSARAAAAGRRARMPRSVWLRLAPPGPDGEPSQEAFATPGVRYQKVLWDSALPGLAGPVVVRVHAATAADGTPAGTQAVVVEAPDGTGLLPVGRLRHRPPAGRVLTPLPDPLPSTFPVLTAVGFWAAVTLVAAARVPSALSRHHLEVPGPTVPGTVPLVVALLVAGAVALWPGPPVGAGRHEPGG